MLSGKQQVGLKKLNPAAFLDGCRSGHFRAATVISAAGGTLPTSVSASKTKTRDSPSTNYKER